MGPAARSAAPSLRHKCESVNFGNQCKITSHCKITKQCKVTNGFPRNAVRPSRHPDGTVLRAAQPARRLSCWSVMP